MHSASPMREIPVPPKGWWRAPTTSLPSCDAPAVSSCCINYARVGVNFSATPNLPNFNVLTRQDRQNREILFTELGLTHRHVLSMLCSLFSEEPKRCKNNLS